MPRGMDWRCLESAITPLLLIGSIFLTRPAFSVEFNGGASMGQLVVDYFSAPGQWLSRKLRIPKPPLRLLPVEKIDPPRKISAEQWDGPFCKQWTDDCIRCKRINDKGKASCHAVQSTPSPTACTPREVICEKTVANDALFGLCRATETHSVTRYEGQRESTSVQGRAGATWSYDLRSKRPQWKLTIGEDSTLINRSSKEKSRPKLEYIAADEVCVQSISAPTDYINSDPAVLIEQP